LSELGEQARGSGKAPAQVFVTGDDDIGKVAEDLVAAAAALAGVEAPRISRVSKLAKSFSLTAEPALFEKLAGDRRVKSILPSVVPDIHPRPLGPLPGKPGDSRS
jgi:hypothetical protein